ncbi:hypothetical protein LPJ81_003050 [Coemansia sp. IMI 209127]|nr:hypothetical protein LPJ81_003050 [Coemansia sp. IMI 209127]
MQHQKTMRRCNLVLRQVISSVLRARTVYKSEEAGSSSGDYSNSGESESSDTDDDKGSSGHSAKQQRIVSDLEYGAELGALKRFKPFNISAISSAAEAFGIPFSTSLLVEAAKRLREPTKAQNTGISHSESDLQPSLLNASESDSSVRLGLAEDAANVADGNADDVEEDIPAPIDMSGLASVLGDSTLACALEDPEKAQLILEYVKGLLKAKNQATQV